MDEEEAFLHRIAVDPDDDLPRLVYADWLEERADPRHEFLRLAVKVRGKIITPSDLQTLLKRLCDLRRIVSAEWVRQVHPTLAMDDVREVVFHQLLGGGERASGAFIEVDGQDPSSYLVGLLTRRYSCVELASTISKSVVDGEEYVLPPPGGGIHSVDEGRWDEDGWCHIGGSSYFSPLAASGNEYRVGVKDGWWAVESAARSWIS